MARDDISVEEAERLDRTLTDILDPVRATAMNAALGLPRKEFKSGDALPDFWHHAYFWDIEVEDRLGRDGHPKAGAFIPNTGLPRRMWAGGHLHFLEPVILGQPAEKVSSIKAVDEKDGGTGKLAAVMVHHEIMQNGKVCVREDQTLIYRDAYDPEEPKPVYDHTLEAPEFAEEVVFSSVQLFRYSAITFNGHRIHYDAPYAENGEGFEDVVVHGPLLAQQLIMMAERHNVEVTRFQYRATAPLSVMEPAVICAIRTGGGMRLWIEGTDRRVCMTAEVISGDGLS
ncbi:MAG: acyl dehydratase [Pseudomonadota bacterium]